jgi:hypothetical protein
VERNEDWPAKQLPDLVPLLSGQPQSGIADGSPRLARFPLVAI